MNRTHFKPDRRLARIFDVFISFVQQRPTSTLIVIFCSVLIMMIIPIFKIINATAFEDAYIYTQVFREFRSLYTSEVVARIRQSGKIEVTHDYLDKEHAIPLPATLSMLLGERITKFGEGGQIKLYSTYPFPWRRSTGGLQDKFAQDAWDTLTHQPNEPFYRVEELDGQRVLRYATADIMRKSCIPCHNSHPNTPKKDWQEGDVRGVLEIVLPLKSIKSPMNSRIRNIVINSTLITTGILSILGLIIFRFRESTITLQKNEQILNQNNVELEKQGWIREGQTKVDEAMRGELSETDLAKRIIDCISTYSGASVGALYLMDKRQKLNLTASYGFTDRENKFSSFELGESLIGQAALERRVIQFSDVSEDVPKINYGIGEKKPHHFLIVPFLYDEVVVGVLEIGTMKKINETHIDFLKQLSDSIAISLNMARSRVQMRELLEQTQQQSEELFEKQKELKLANEELEDKTKALQHQKSEIEHSKYKVEEKASELKKANQYKSEFLANVSHEFRTPLNSLLILSKSLSENDEGNLTEDQIESAKIIHKGGENLLNLINDILDLSKVEAGKLDVCFSKVRTNSIIKNLVEQFTPIAKERGIEIIVTTASNIPEFIKTDDQRVGQVLRNLLSNAIKFTQQGSVTINTYIPNHETQFKFKNFNASNSIAFSIIDTGCGISQEKISSIFEAFQQADGSVSRLYGGTGLGLTISRELTRLLGGEMRVKSHIGEGSVFTLYLPMGDGLEKTKTSSNSDDYGEQLPLKPEIPAVAQRADIDRINAIPMFIPDDRHTINDRDKSILFIEDDASFSKLLIDLSRKRNFKCIAAGSGESGMNLATYYKPTAIVLDIGLPDISGLDVLDLLKKNPETQAIPVHVISGIDHEFLSKRKGSVGFLKKPLQKEEIEELFFEIEHVREDKIRKVLLIEDDSNSQLAITKLLTSSTVHTTTAESGKKACDLMAKNVYDCIIVDLGLSDISGLDLLRKLRDQSTEIPPIIIHTGRELTQEESNNLKLYANSIIIKGAKSIERLINEVSLFIHKIDPSPAIDSNQTSDRYDRSKISLKDRKILLVDDDMRNVYALAKSLNKYGLIVEMTDNGKSAIEKVINEDNVELILMDIMMPIMDGMEAIRKIREIEEYKTLPIIALTADATEDSRTRCIEAGANDYLNKPIDIDRLISILKVWLFKQK